MLFAFLSNHIIYKSLQNLFSKKKTKKSQLVELVDCSNLLETRSIPSLDIQPRKTFRGGQPICRAKTNRIFQKHTRGSEEAWPILGGSGTRWYAWTTLPFFSLSSPFLFLSSSRRWIL